MNVPWKFLTMHVLFFLWKAYVFPTTISTGTYVSIRSWLGSVVLWFCQIQLPFGYASIQRGTSPLDMGSFTLPSRHIDKSIFYFTLHTQQRDGNRGHTTFDGCWHMFDLWLYLCPNFPSTSRLMVKNSIWSCDMALLNHTILTPCYDLLTTGTSLNLCTKQKAQNVLLSPI